MDITNLMDNMDRDPVQINPTQHRNLGIRAVQYAQERGLDVTETKELLEMIGL